MSIRASRERGSLREGLQHRAASRSSGRHSIFPAATCLEVLKGVVSALGSTMFSSGARLAESASGALERFLIHRGDRQFGSTLQKGAEGLPPLVQGACSSWWEIAKCRTRKSGRDYRGS